VPSVTQPTNFLSAISRSGLLTDAQVADAFDGPPPADPMQCAAALVKAGLLTQFQASQLLSGKTRGFVLGPYKLLRPLGQGGMGVVYLAEHSGLGRKVAIKVLPPEKAKDQINLERFQREARSAAALDHPNIVRLHDISQGGGVHFLVFEYAEGKDLQALLGDTGALHFAQAAHYVAQAAVGLQHAHARGFVHRDIKPANLMLTKDGTVKLLDMGLARSFDNPGDNLTANLGDGEIVGTVDYVSPEQCRGDRVDERSDIYSLGVTLFALVAGHPPFTGSATQKMMQHQLSEPQKLNKLRDRVPGPLCDVIAKMMAKAPKDRYQTAEEVADALAPWLPAPSTGRVPKESGTEDATAFRVGGSSRAKARPAPRPVWKRKPVLIGAGVAVLLAGVALAVALSGGSEPQKQPVGPPLANNNPNPNPNPNPLTTDPPPKADPPAPAATRVYRLDTSKVEPFRETVDSKVGPRPDHLQQVLPGWAGQSWEAGTEAEFLAERAGDRVVLGVAPRPGKNAAQWVFRPNEASALALTPGKRYEARIEYKTDRGMSAWAFLATQGDWSRLGGAGLPESAEWRTLTFAFVVPEGKDLQFTFGTDGGAGAFLRLRGFELHDLSPGGRESGAPAGKVLYALDLSAQKAFHDRGRTKILGSGTWAWDSEQKEGAGALPPGWSAFPWRLEDEAEYFAEEVNGKLVLGMRTVRGMGSAMMFTPTITFPSDKARLTVEYRTPVGQSVSLYTKFQRTKPTNEKARDLKVFPATNGAWRTESVEVDLRGATAGFFEMHNNYGDGQPIHLRALSVTNGAGEPASAKPPAAPVVPVRADFGAFKPGTLALSASGAEGADASAALEATGWWANLYESGATGELTAGTEGGTPVVTLVNKDGTPSLQLYQPKPGPALAAGKQYLLKFEYRATEGTHGLLDVRDQNVGNWKDCPYSYKLEPTDGKWEARTFEVEPLRDYPTVFVIQNRSGTPGNALSVRKVELVPVGAP
jgi:serine/threonine protein kinase